MSFDTPTSLSFPSYVNGKVLDKSGVNFSPDWNIYFSQLTQQLQNNFSNEGVTMPAQTTANLTNLVAQDTDGLLNNKLVVDSDTGDLKFIQNGVIKTVTVT